MIAVLGGTGRIGCHAAAGLADAGAEARALVREPDAADPPIPAVHADLTDPASLLAGLEGAERLLLITPHGPDQDLLEAAAVDAAARAGVGHVVKVSGGPATLGPNGPTATGVAHWRSERRIEDSGMGFTFLRPSFLMQNLVEQFAPAVAATGLLAAPMGSAPVAMVDARDVAACAVAALLDPDPVDRAWHPSGPRAVPFTTVADALGVRYLPVPERVARRALARSGSDPWEVEHAGRMSAFIRAGGDGATSDHVLRLTGNPPRGIDDFLAEHRDDFAPRSGLARTLSRTKRKNRRS